mgnify:CR=1 FL=1
MSSPKDVEREVLEKKEQETLDKISRETKTLHSNSSVLDEETYKFDEITYLKDYKKNVNLSYLQSIVLISAFIAGSNREATDIKLFEMDKSKYRFKKGSAIERSAATLGKTRRFPLERLIAIADYLSSLEIEGSYENTKLNHTLEFYSCINSLC